jgi:hypothetical protein
MAQSGFTPVQHYRSATAAATPSAGNLVFGELALNYFDGNLFFKDASNIVRLLASTAAATGTVSSVQASGGTTGLTFSGGPVTTAGTLTLGGTLAVANGGTGVTTSTGSGSVVLSTSPTLVTPILGAASATSIANGLGAVGTPSYTFTGDTNTGMWSPAADTIAFSEGGVEAMRIDSSGNVGIGTSAPGALLGASSGALGTTAGNTATITKFFGSTANERALTTRLIRNTNGSDWTTTTLRLQNSIDVTESAYIDFSPNGTHDLAFGTGAGATERMRIDASGNVGIGLTAPAYRLHVGGRITSQTSTSDWAFLNDASGGAVRGGLWVFPGGDIGVANSTVANGWFVGASTTYAITNFAERMRITDSGNVGIGSVADEFGKSWRLVARHDQNAITRFGVINNTVGVSATAQISKITGTGNSFVEWELADNNGSPYDTFAYGSVVQYVSWFLGGSERMRIDSSGNVGIGTTSAPARLSVSTSAANGLSLDVQGAANNALFEKNNTAGGYCVFNFSGAFVGSITTNGTTTAYNTSSDARLKDNIADADSASSLIDAIQVRKFDWKADGSHQRYGFVAQELVEVAPEAVSVPQDEDQMMVVDYSKLVPMLVKEIQSLRARVAQLERN